MGLLDQHAHSVTGIHLAAAGAAMQQVLEDGQGILDYLVGFASLDIHHESHATGIVFRGGVIKPLGRRSLPVVVF